MPHLTLNLTQAGPLLDVLIGVSQAKEEALKKAGIPVPTLTPARALIDTGASGTVIDPDVIDKLLLTPTGKGSTLTASTGSVPHEADLYDISIHIPIQRTIKIFPSVPIMALELAPLGVQVLIGRDILNQGLFIYDGPTQKYTLSF
jgi:predicted aspartyl protease